MSVCPAKFTTSKMKRYILIFPVCCFDVESRSKKEPSHDLVHLPVVDVPECNTQIPLLFSVSTTDVSKAKKWPQGGEGLRGAPQVDRSWNIVPTTSSHDVLYIIYLGSSLIWDGYTKITVSSPPGFMVQSASPWSVKWQEMKEKNSGDPTASMYPNS